MPTVQKRTFSLPEEKASYIDSLVAAGTYESGSDVVSAGIEALQDRDATIEQWLREEVLPVAEAMEANPGRGVPLDQAMERLREHHKVQVRNSRK